MMLVVPVVFVDFLRFKFITMKQTFIPTLLLTVAVLFSSCGGGSSKSEKKSEAKVKGDFDSYRDEDITGI